MNWVLQVFTNPTLAYEAVKEKTPILVPVVLIVVVLGGIGLLLQPVIARDNAEIVSQNPRLSEMLTEEQMESIRNPSAGRMAMGVVMQPVVSLIGLSLYSLLLLIAANIAGCELNYKTIFSAVLAASLIDPVLSSLVKTPLILAKGTSLGVSTSLALLAPDAPLTSVTYQVLGVFDLFELWALVVLITGFSVIAHIKKSKAASIVIAVWIVWSAAVILISVVSSKLTGISG
jgi:hypothetical protein